MFTGWTIGLALSLPLGAQDLSLEMVEGIHAFLDEKSARHVVNRPPVQPDRERFRRIIGAVDPRLSPVEMHRDELARGPGYRIFIVRWTVFAGVHGEGILLEPDTTPKARVVALPDADWTPEALAGLVPGIPAKSQFARRLAENGAQVLIPTLIDRSDRWSGVPTVRMTNMPHREFLYRMAYQVGRHIIGYEVQKVLAGVDWFTGQPGSIPISVAGYGEGGLLAFYAAALDTRISAALVSGYFGPRWQVHREPVYRAVWGLLPEFADAELTQLIAPRRLVIEASPFPKISGPPPVTAQRRGAEPNGRLETPALPNIRAEAARTRGVLIESDAPGSEKALGALLGAPLGNPRPALAVSVKADARQERQFRELWAFTHQVVMDSQESRAKLWSVAERSSPEGWQRTTRPLRDLVWEEVVGRLPYPTLAPNPRMKQIGENARFKTYEVVLDVWPRVFTYGWLLVPNGIKTGERRATVVCQHGLEGRPRDVADPDFENPAYHKYAARLADLGYVVYAPQNPYIGGDRFRAAQRKAQPWKLTLFSFITGMHQQQVRWLATLPYVDPKRIAFYGLSYGGKTAMYVPPLIDEYAVVICSGNFNEWIWKTATTDHKSTYPFTHEFEIVEFNVGNIANHAELASLIFPRPFMVERGHHDGVAPDEWVAYEYARVRRHYAEFGLADRTEIEFFNGVHEIHAVGTFAFLKTHLGPP